MIPDTNAYSSYVNPDRRTRRWKEGDERLIFPTQESFLSEPELHCLIKVVSVLLIFEVQVSDVWQVDNDELSIIPRIPI